MTHKNSYLAPVGTVELTGANQVAVSGGCIFYGTSIMDEGNGQVKVQVYDGVDDTGKHLAQVNINANGNDHYWFGPNGVKCDVGIYIKVYTGTPVGVVFYR